MSEFAFRPEDPKQSEIAYEKDRVKHLKEILECTRTLVIKGDAEENFITILEQEILERNIRIEKLGGEVEE